MKRLSILAALALSASLAACASQPEPEPMPEPEPTPVYQPEPDNMGPIPGSVEDFEVNAGDRVFFALDQHTLSNEASTTMLRQAAWLSS